MATTYRLVNLHAASLVGTYDIEDEALADMARSVRQNSTLRSNRHIALQRHMPGEPDEPLASGEDLARRALDALPQLRRSSAKELPRPVP